MKGKKVLKILVIFLIIVIILLIVDFVIIHFDGFLNKENVMSRDEVIALLEKGKEYPNYYFSSETKGIMGLIEKIYYKSNNVKTEIYAKDNITKTVVGGKVSLWEDYNTKEAINLKEVINVMGEYNNKKYASITFLDDEEDEVSEENQRGFDYSLISREKDFNTDFKYLGEKKENGKTIVIVKVWNKDGLSIDSTKFYIDKETGLIVRRVDYLILGLFRIKVDRNLKLDSVTDKDVERPDLEGYIVNGVSE